MQIVKFNLFSKIDSPLQDHKSIFWFLDRTQPIFFLTEKANYFFAETVPCEIKASSGHEELWVSLMVPHRGQPSNDVDKGGGGAPGSVLGASLSKLYRLEVNSRKRKYTKRNLRMSFIF